MDNSETLTAFGIQDTRRRQTKQKPIKKTKKRNQGARKG